MNHPIPYTTHPRSSGAIDILDARGDYVATVGPLGDDAETARVAAGFVTMPELRDALDRLAGEVDACWHMREGLLRHELGNTNYQTVADRILAARAAIARAEGR